MLDYLEITALQQLRTVRLSLDSYLLEVMLDEQSRHDRNLVFLKQLLIDKSGGSDQSIQDNICKLLDRIQDMRTFQQTVTDIIIPSHLLTHLYLDAGPEPCADYILQFYSQEIKPYQILRLLSIEPEVKDRRAVRVDKYLAQCHPEAITPEQKRVLFLNARP